VDAGAIIRDSAVRLFIAAFAAPWIEAIIVYVVIDVSPLVFGLALIFGYVAIGLCGFPIYLLCRAKGWTSPWIAPPAGFVIGGVSCIAFFALFAASLGSPVLAVFERGSLVLAIWPCGAAGAAAATVFWLIARPDLR
jgi:hypothetical protein